MKDLETRQILRVLVGSQAHGLADEHSDEDWRGVFVRPTSQLLRLGPTPPRTVWEEGAVDDVSWELGHFLFLATKCNPTILEVFLSPEFVATAYGAQLRELFPAVWNSVGVMNAFIGYSHNQRKKLLDGKDARPSKYASAYLRTLYNAWELLATGTFHVRVADMPIGPVLRRIRAHDYTLGDVINLCYDWEQRVREAFDANPAKQTDLERVNAFLLRVRREEWEYDSTTANDHPMQRLAGIRQDDLGQRAAEDEP